MDCEKCSNILQCITTVLIVLIACKPITISWLNFDELSQMLNELSIHSSIPRRPETWCEKLSASNVEQILQ